MAGQGHMPQHMPQPDARHPGMVPDHFGPVMGHPLGPHPMEQLPPIELLDRRLAAQHEELLRLAMDNRRLGATHVALREELAGAQQELQRMAAILGDKEQQVRGLIDKTTKMEAEFQTVETLKGELQQSQADVQSLMSIREDLTGQVQQLTAELQRAHAEVQQIPVLHAEMDGLGQELHRTRNAFEYQTAANNEQMHQMQAMEKNLVSMAREVEKLRAQLATADKRVHGGAYGAAFNDPNSPFHSAGPNMYGDGYGNSQMPINAGSAATYGAGPVVGRAGYDVPQGGVSQKPVTPENAATYGAATYGAATYGAGRGGYDMPRVGGSQISVAPVNGNPYGAGPTPARGGYDMPQSGTTHARR